MITPDKLGADEDLAREVLIIGRSIAPCLASFPDDSEEQKDAIAVLKRVYTECLARGSRFVKGQSIGPGRIEYRDIVSAFDGDPRSALRALCSSAGAALSGMPRGSFPQPDRSIGRLWPERYGS